MQSVRSELEAGRRTSPRAPLAIVFDDAETLGEAPSAMEVVARLLLSDSPLLRVALASRRRLNMRLARAQAGGRIVEFGPSELTFSAGECAECLRRAAGHDPKPAEVEALLEATEGWPLGVGLAASRGDGPTGGPSPALAYDYSRRRCFRPSTQTCAARCWLRVSESSRSTPGSA